ncbi:MAG TPA: anhydro-N-acetylmuramic acid kinase, partial [Flavitalea sp.]|nr:anhydro-N-acetylmuramic acid kinase [Flavitalea sp.]
SVCLQLQIAQLTYPAADNRVGIAQISDHVCYALLNLPDKSTPKYLHMVYRVIGTMSGSSLDGLDIAFVELQEVSGSWSYNLRNAVCYPYEKEWTEKLSRATALNAIDYHLLDCAYGSYCGQLINRFIQENNIQYQVQLISSHGHTTFHIPDKHMSCQLGNGAVIAAATGVNVVSSLRSMDVALCGQGAPIVPIGEKLLLGDYLFYLNLGGIANISLNHNSHYVAFDVCPANKVLNLLAKESGKNFDDGGQLAEKGELNQTLLDILNDFEYYRMPYPKSLSNDFGTDVIFPLIHNRNADTDDDLRTYVEHICMQVVKAVALLQKDFSLSGEQKMLVTGGGAMNSFLIKRLTEVLQELNVYIEVPADDLIVFKEAIIMALIGVLRWREESNTLASVTGASRDSIGGCVWIGQEA